MKILFFDIETVPTEQSLQDNGLLESQIRLDEAEIIKKLSLAAATSRILCLAYALEPPLDSFVEDDEAFEERIRFIHERMNQPALAEEYIEGREIYVSLLGNERLQVFPFREVIFTEVPDGQPKFSTFKAKWDDAYRKRWGIQNVFAEPFVNGTGQRIVKICKDVYRALRIHGYGRIDLRVTPEGEIVILEANPNPNLDRDDEFGQSAAKAGLSYPRMIQCILKLAFDAAR